MKYLIFLPVFVCLPFRILSQPSQPTDYSGYILTPPPPRSPRINGPGVYGVRPGHPVIYRIPCTGDRPMKFSAVNLPEGLALDTVKGIITGTVSVPGTYNLTLCAWNNMGKDCREFDIIAGERIALTPPMGWNSWYIHYNRINDKLMRQAADQMIASGMADYGYQYVNIDDCWMEKVNPGETEERGRDAGGAILSNDRFPDMKKMTDYIHSRGLKAGIYISPGLTTCAGYEGSYGHEAQDGNSFAIWGFDFLKYDWCSYADKVGGKTIEDLIKPYEIMWNILQRQDRDIVLNLCQYGMGNVWEWGGGVGNCWRTTGDLGLEKNTGLPGFYSIGMSNAEHWPYAKPGAWNDPDYILIGWVGNAHKMAEGTPTDLTPYEQYSYMSMWSLMAAPLIFSGDMARLDPFTLNVLCNNEVIDVNQDPLGLQARIIRKTKDEFVLAKSLEDGSLAVGIFNLKDHEADPVVTWDELNISGRQKIRDLWRQTDIGNLENEYRAEIPPHGVKMVRIRAE